MRFLVDECTGPAVARWLLERGHDVYSVYDEAVIRKAYDENRILITNDKDFGEKVFREHYVHHGVVLLRLSNERSKNKISVIQKLLEEHGENLPNRFVVVTERQVRFARMRG